MSVDFPQEVLSETALIADATGMAIPAASAAVPPVCSDLAGAGVHDGGGVTKWCDKCPGAPSPTSISLPRNQRCASHLRISRGHHPSPSTRIRPLIAPFCTPSPGVCRITGCNSVDVALMMRRDDAFSVARTDAMSGDSEIAPPPPPLRLRPINRNESGQVCPRLAKSARGFYLMEKTPGAGFVMNQFHYVRTRAPGRGSAGPRFRSDLQ